MSNGVLISSNLITVVSGIQRLSYLQLTELLQYHMNLQLKLLGSLTS